MSILSKLFGGGDGPTPPESVACEGAAGSVYAPARGSVVAMADLPDPVFAAGVMGPAVGIKPADGIVYAPVSGEVTVVTTTMHALGLRSTGGIEVLIHAGVNTVDLRGKGFEGFVKKGAYVRAGEPLLTMDLDQVAEAGFDDTVIVVITNADELGEVEVVASGTVEAGVPAMRLSS